MSTAWRSGDEHVSVTWQEDFDEFQTQREGNLKKNLLWAFVQCLSHTKTSFYKTADDGNFYWEWTNRDLFHLRRREPDWPSPTGKRLMKLFVLSEHAAGEELLTSSPSDALRGVFNGRRRLSRNIHREYKMQTPAGSISGWRCCCGCFYLGLGLAFKHKILSKCGC